MINKTRKKKMSYTNKTKKKSIYHNKALKLMTLRRLCNKDIKRNRKFELNIIIRVKLEPIMITKVNSLFKGS